MARQFVTFRRSPVFRQRWLRPPVYVVLAVAGAVVALVLDRPWWLGAAAAVVGAWLLTFTSVRGWADRPLRRPRQVLAVVRATGFPVYGLEGEPDSLDWHATSTRVRLITLTYQGGTVWVSTSRMEQVTPLDHLGAPDETSERTLPVDGRVVPFLVADVGDEVRATATIDDVDVTVTALGVPLDDLRLVRMDPGSLRAR